MTIELKWAQFDTPIRLPGRKIKTTAIMVTVGDNVDRLWEEEGRLWMTKRGETVYTTAPHTALPFPEVAIEPGPKTSKTPARRGRPPKQAKG